MATGYANLTLGDFLDYWPVLGRRSPITGEHDIETIVLEQQAGHFNAWALVAGDWDEGDDDQYNDLAENYTVTMRLRATTNPDIAPGVYKDMPIGDLFRFRNWAVYRPSVLYISPDDKTLLATSWVPTQNRMRKGLTLAYARCLSVDHARRPEHLLDTMRHLGYRKEAIYQGVVNTLYFGNGPQGLGLGTTVRRTRIRIGREELLSEEHDRKVLIPEAMYAAIRHESGKVAVYCADQFLVGHLRVVNGTHVIDAARGVLAGAVSQAARAFQVQILQEA